MSELDTIMGDHILGVPIPVVLGVVGVGVVVVLYMSSKSSAPAATPTSTANAALAKSLQSALHQTSINQTGSAGTQSVPGSPTATTNTQWEFQAQQFLVAKGYDPLLASNALALYLAGATLTQEEQATVDAAIAGVGLPPNPPGPISGLQTPTAPTAPTAPVTPPTQTVPTQGTPVQTTPTPVPVQAPAPTQPTTHPNNWDVQEILPGMNLWTQTMRAYGTNNATTGTVEAALFAYNKANGGLVHSPNSSLIYPGDWCIYPSTNSWPPFPYPRTGSVL